jgi:hypothetical protein
MRPKIVIPLIFAALVALLLPVLFNHRPPANISVTQILPKTVKPVQEKLAFHTSNSSQKKSAPETDVVTNGSTDQDEEDFVAERVSELHDLGMTGDPDSLSTITSELDSREPQIREAALKAAIQFGSRDAIPALQNTLQHTDDPQEKVDLQKAVDFLQLPTMSEIANRNN